MLKFTVNPDSTVTVERSYGRTSRGHSIDVTLSRPSPDRKLSDEAVRDIRESALSLRPLAKKHGVSRETIRMVRLHQDISGGRMNAFIDSVQTDRDLRSIIGPPARCPDCGQPIIIASTAGFTRTDIRLDAAKVWRQVGFHLDGEPKVEAVDNAGVEHRCPRAPLRIELSVKDQLQGTR